MCLLKAKGMELDKKTERSADSIMEGQKEKNAVIDMVSGPALTLLGFINFFKECIMKLIFAT